MIVEKHETGFRNEKHGWEENGDRMFEIPLYSKLRSAEAIMTVPPVITAASRIAV